MIDWPAGISSAALKPCTTRSPISQPTLGARAHKPEAAVNATSEPSHTRPAPARRPSQPESGSATANASK
jgi:hypothetical protein